MPAVNPTRLRFQVENLLAYFQSPPEFHHQLQDLFNHYAHHSLRPGDSVGLKPLIPVYHIPAPVVRQLQQDLKPQVEAAPQAALALADELWTDFYLEIKQIAVFILGCVPIQSPDLILDRARAWLTPNLDSTLIADLFSTGTRQLQASFPDVWETFIQSLLTESDPAQLTLGIMGLTEGIKNPDFKNLPAIYRLISPILRQPDRALLPSLSRLVQALALNSPTETAFFLRQTLSLTESQETVRLVKNCLSYFPETIQNDMLAILRK